MANDLTKLNNLIDPEVFADYVDQKYVDKGVFTALATVDSTLEGNVGDTLSFPSYGYIGPASEVAEGEEIGTEILTATSTPVKVKKIAKGIEISDEAMLSALGNPMEEGASQVAISLADYSDNDLKASIDEANVLRLLVDGMSSDNIVDAIALWGEDLNDKPFALVTSGKGLAALRKDDDFINASEMQTSAMIRGTVGSIWGANIIPSNKVTNGGGYLIKQGALRIVTKRGVNAEPKRKPETKTTALYTDKIYAPYVYKAQDIIVLEAHPTLTDLSDKITSKAGEVSGGTVINYADLIKLCPANCSLVYKLGSSDVTFNRDNAIGTGYTPLTADEIAGGSSTKIAIAIVDADNKPIYGGNATLVKKS